MHLYGHPVDMDPLIELAEEKDLYLIEDAAQAHGALYKSKIIGSLGDIGCFSFFPSKIITVAGDGGMVVTNNEELGEKISIIKDHGRKKKYLFEIMGMNFRMSEIHAAIGRIQLKHINDWIEARRRVAKDYNAALSGIQNVILPTEEKWAKHVYYLYVIRAKKRAELSEYLKSKEIDTGIHYQVPLHQQPNLQPYIDKVKLKNTETVCEEILSLPTYPTLEKEKIEFIAKEIKSFYKGV